MSLSSLSHVKRTTNNNRPPVPKKAIFTTFCGDRSGSMCSFGNSIKIQLKELIKTTKENSINNNVDSFFTLTTFDDVSETYINNKNVLYLDIPNDIDVNNWLNPRGSTRLIDTAIECINKQNNDILEYYNSLPKKIQNLVNLNDIHKIFVLFTDGNDNSSLKFKQDLNILLEKYKKDDGLALFMGANQDAVETGIKYGFSPNTSLTVGSDSRSATTAFGCALPLIRTTSCGYSSRTVSYTQAQRQASYRNVPINTPNTKPKTLYRTKSIQIPAPLSLAIPIYTHGTNVSSPKILSPE